MHARTPLPFLAGILVAQASTALAGATPASTERWGFREPDLVSEGAADSLVKRIRSAIIIPAGDHEELWVHPELFTTPGSPGAAEFRARTTDRSGKDQHSTWHYFRTADGFRTLQPLGKPNAELWGQKDLSAKRLLPATDGSVKVPEQLGHTWCSAYVHLDPKTVLQAFTVKDGSRNAVRTLLARVERDGLRPIHVSAPHSIPVGRGLYEPHIAVWRSRCFMTLRAEDGHGYVQASEDGGRTWSKPQPWRWDDGKAIAMDQTMTKFASHANGLVLVYTRIREDNANAFRHRAPIHVADVDPGTLTLRRGTERIAVPNRSTGPKGLPVGNFWVWPASPNETYVTVAEWPRDGRPQNGDLWLAKIEWREPNSLVTEDGQFEAASTHRSVPDAGTRR